MLRSCSCSSRTYSICTVSNTVSRTCSFSSSSSSSPASLPPTASSFKRGYSKYAQVSPHHSQVSGVHTTFTPEQQDQIAAARRSIFGGAEPQPGRHNRPLDYLFKRALAGPKIKNFYGDWDIPHRYTPHSLYAEMLRREKRFDQLGLIEQANEKEANKLAAKLQHEKQVRLSEERAAAKAAAMEQSKRTKALEAERMKAQDAAKVEQEKSAREAVAAMLSKKSASKSKD